jgi:hypothetical protein
MRSPMKLFGIDGVSCRVFSIDSWILDVTEWACRKFQLLTGFTNVWLAVQVTNVSIVVYFIWAGAYFWGGDLLTRIFIGLFCGGLLYLLAQTILRVPIETYEMSTYRRVAQGLRNPKRLRDALLRITFLIMVVVLPGPTFFVYAHRHSGTLLASYVLILCYVLVLLTTVVLYLLACDPLPPCKGRVREWFRDLVGSPVPASESTNGATRDAGSLSGRWRGLSVRQLALRVNDSSREVVDDGRIAANGREVSRTE